MWTTIVICISTHCGPLPPPTLHATSEQCERALKLVYTTWRPAVGDYAFNCRRS